MDTRNHNNNNTNDNDEVTRSSVPTCYLHLQDSSRNNEMRIMPLTAPITLASFRNIHPQTLQDVSTLIECDSRTSNPVRSGKIVAAKSDMLLPGKHYLVRQSGARNDVNGENDNNNFNSATALNNNNNMQHHQQQQQQQQRTKSAPGVTFNSMMLIREYSLSFANSVSQSPSNHHLHHHQFEQPQQLPPHFSFPRSRNNNNNNNNNNNSQQSSLAEQQQQRLTQQLERVQRDSCFQPNNLDVTSENFIVPQFEGDRDAIDFSTSLQSCNNNVNIFPMTYYYYSIPNSQQQKSEQKAVLHSQDELNQMLGYDYEGENQKIKDEYQQLVSGR